MYSYCSCFNLLHYASNIKYTYEHDYLRIYLPKNCVLLFIITLVLTTKGLMVSTCLKLLRTYE